MSTDNITMLMNIQQVCDRILMEGKLTRAEHMQLMTNCLNDALINKHERQSINQVLDEIQLGQLRFVEPLPEQIQGSSQD